MKTKISNTNIRHLYLEALEKGLKQQMVLFLWEGKSVCPKNYLKELHDRFEYIFTWNDDFVDNKKLFKIYLPITKSFIDVPKINFNKKKLLVNISMNKSSSFNRELYSTRKKTIKYFDNNYPNDFDLYGIGWNKARNYTEKCFPWLVEKYSSYKGKLNNKMDVLPYYKFSLCYENMQGENGYITEKIFDSMRAGVVPIYWGAENIEDYVDKNAFIDRRLFDSDKELANFIVNMSENDYDKYINAINIYLKSEKFSLFLPDNFANTIIKTLKL